MLSTNVWYFHGFTCAPVVVNLFMKVFDWHFNPFFFDVLLQANLNHLERTFSNKGIITRLSTIKSHVDRRYLIGISILAWLWSTNLITVRCLRIQKSQLLAKRQDILSESFFNMIFLNSRSGISLIANLTHNSGLTSIFVLRCSNRNKITVFL